MSPDLFALISRHELDEGDRGAVGTSDLQVTLSYRQLVALVHSAASQLARVGLHRDDVVAMVTDNSIESVIGLLAVVSSGGAVAPLDPALTTAEVDARCAAASVRARLVGAQNADQIGRSQDVAGGLDRWTIAVAGSGESMTVEVSRANDADEKGQGAARSGGHAIVDDVALVLFTAGSTSAPKAVPLTHQNLIASINGIVTTYELAPTDATLVVMPLFHGHGLVAGLLATLVSGGTAYLPSTGEFSAHLFWADMARTGATWYTAVPTIHRILVDRAPQEYPSDAPVPLRFIRSCSAPLDPALAAALTTAFHAPVIGAYGMTETAHQTTSNPLPSKGRDKEASVGLPTGVELRIVSDDEGEIDDGVGNIDGEIWVRGEAVAAGYLNDDGTDSYTDGWFRTGDLGRTDDDGYLFIAGRRKDIINRGGEKISPDHVDAALLSHPKVLESATFGESDAKYGEQVQSAVILRPGATATEGELTDYSRARLAGFEVPARIHVVDRLPRTEKGSVDRRALATQFASGDDRGHA